MTRLRVMLFTGAAQADNVNRLVLGLEKGFRELGHDTRVVDSRGADWMRIANEQGPYDFVLGMAGIGPGGPDDFEFHNRLRLGFVGMMLDPLVRYVDRIGLGLDRHLLTTTSDCDLDYFGDCPLGKPLLHVPHGAEPVEDGLPDWSQRDLPILFSGGCSGDPQSLRAGWAQHGERRRSLLHSILEEVRRDPLRPLTASVEAVVGVGDRPRMDMEFYSYFTLIDQYLRAETRWRMIDALRRMPVTVVGGGWEAFPRKPDDRLRFLPAMPSRAVVSMMRRSRVVLNSCTGHHGSHERVFDAQAQGAFALSSETRWFRQVTGEQAVMGMVQADGDNWADQVNGAMNDPHLADKAAAGCMWQRQHHSWRHRAQDIADAWRSRVAS